MRPTFCFFCIAALTIAPIVQAPATPAIAGTASAQQPPPRTDLYGDPLPPGAVARLGTLRLQQAGQGGPLVFSRDGKKLFTLDNNGRLLMWDAAAGKLLGELQGPNEWGRCLSLSPDGKYLAANAGKLIRVWNLANGDQRDLNGHDTNVCGLDFSPDSRTLVSAALDASPFGSGGIGGVPVIGLEDRDVRLWDIVTGKLVGKLADQPESLSSVICTADGKQLAIGSQWGMVRIVDKVSGKKVREFKVGYECVVQKLQISPDRKTLFAVGYSIETLKLGGGLFLSWDITTGKQLPDLFPKFVGTFAISPDAKHLAVSGENTVSLLDVATGKSIRSFTSIGNSFYDLAFSPDGKCLAATTWGPRICLWDVATGKEQFENPSPAGAVDFARFLPDGKTAITVGRDNHTRLWDAMTGKPLRDFPIESELASNCDLSPDGKLLVVGYMMWDVAKGKTLWNAGGTIGWHNVISVKFAPDGKAIALVHGINGFAFGSGTGGAGVGGKVGRGGFGGPGGSRAPSLSCDILDAATGKLIHSTSKLDFNAQSASVAFSLDGKQLILSVNGQLHHWDLNAKKWVRTIVGNHGDWLYFAPDGKTFGLSAKPATRIGIVVHDAATANPLRSLPVHPHEHFAALSPNGKMAALLPNKGATSAVCLRDLSSGKRLAVLDGKYGNVKHVSFSPDGKQILTAHADSTALIWDLPTLLQQRPASPATKADAVNLLWAKLGNTDEAVAIAALDRLAEAPASALPFLKQHVKPVPDVDLKRLLNDLDSNSYAKREQAMRDITQQDFAAAKALRQVLEDRPSLELRRRVELLLKKLDEPITAPELLASWRAVIVLEQIGTPAAREWLQALANGAEQARLTGEARAALKRLE